ncbi:cupin domain-containing protein [Sphingomonas sp.]|uniref:1,2-dihydroxy-3-keto-5-methylthiopentene dioxygenase n=1 Tax=Sphingomonas sp. TaxID=28214 RepID=UPI001DD1749F|nr:cupin domain-containing protein [Sphingomonas sp.]MBX9796554.1 cupin domain-containing protein [Sphingomonas sp.]
MSRLRIYAEDAPDIALTDTSDAGEIAAALADIGVHFERWPLRAAAAGDMLAAYAPEIAALKAKGGYQSVDIVAMTPDHPERQALRTKFLDEHTHAEDEVRFFIDGEGLFTLHAGGRVFDTLCTAGDLISVPAGMKHWFDMGPAPRFAAIRLFVNPDGWVAQFTGDPIARRFPRHEPAHAPA